MKNPTTPSKKQGEKNVFCVEYKQCLDYVIKMNWEAWNCEGCKDYSEEREKEVLPSREFTEEYPISNYLRRMISF